MNGNLANYEKDDHVLHMPPEEKFPNWGGLGRTLFNFMKKHGDAVAQIDGITGKEDTYSAYLQRCIRTAVKIRSKGFTNKDIITILSYNNLDVTVPFIASLFLGIKVAKIDPSLSTEEVSQLLTKLNTRLIFVDRDNVGLIEKSLKKAEQEAEVVVFGTSTYHTEFSSFLEESVEEKTFETVVVTNLMETAVILFSSGSTGLPKGVCLHHYTFVCFCFQSVSTFPKCNVMLFSSIYWISQTNIMMITIASGSCRIIVPQFDKNAVWGLLSRFKINFMLLAPSQAITWHQLGRPKDLPKLPLMVLYVTGTRTSKENMQNLKTMLPETFVMQAMGMTELSGRGFIIEGRDAPKCDPEKRLTSVGKPGKGISYKIVDLESEKTLGPNQPGELRVKSVFFMNGYFGLDSSNCVDSEGWFKTGDLMYYDEEHYFYHVERIKEIIQFQTHHIHPAVIENVLLLHPDVQAAAVVGVPNLEDIEHPAAAVILKGEVKGNITPEEIVMFVEEKVTDKHRLRGGVKIVSHFPMTTSGKIRRREVQNLFVAHEKI